ncbi:hypothetical protein Tco_0163783 [Tanacetum coccineum]
MIARHQAYISAWSSSDMWSIASRSEGLREASLAVDEMCWGGAVEQAVPTRMDSMTGLDEMRCRGNMRLGLVRIDGLSCGCALVCDVGVGGSAAEGLG